MLIDGNIDSDENLTRRVLVPAGEVLLCCFAELDSVMTKGRQE